MDGFPAWLSNFLAHGYLSTSFFFLLSGFILAYLYWRPTVSFDQPPTFLVAALHARVPRTPDRAGGHHPALPAALLDDPNAPSIPLSVVSGVATATLTQAWVPPLVPVWSWPTWALSAWCSSISSCRG